MKKGLPLAALNRGCDFCRAKHPPVLTGVAGVLWTVGYTRLAPWLHQVDCRTVALHQLS